MGWNGASHFKTFRAYISYAPAGKFCITKNGDRALKIRFSNFFSNRFSFNHNHYNFLNVNGASAAFLSFCTFVIWQLAVIGQLKQPIISAKSTNHRIDQIDHNNHSNNHLFWTKIKIKKLGNFKNGEIFTLDTVSADDVCPKCIFFCFLI